MVFLRDELAVGGAGPFLVVDAGQGDDGGDAVGYEGGDGVRGFQVAEVEVGFDEGEGDVGVVVCGGWLRHGG